MFRTFALRRALTAALLIGAAGCAASARHTVLEGSGPFPALPLPSRSIRPMVNGATAIGWPEGHVPTAATGLAVSAFARDLEHPRWLMVLPNGDVLVAETNAPVRKNADGAPSPNRITLLRDADADGVAETRHVFLSGLNSPFGMVLVGSTLYIANTDALVRVAYTDGQTALTSIPEIVCELPAGTLNHHWTKNVIASPDGSKLYVAVGSNSNVAENGLENEEGRAAVWEIDPATGEHRVFASGLRNPVGMAWEPERGQLWVAVNERDELGSDLVPDYMTTVEDGKFYGWPYAYFGSYVDERVKPRRQDLVDKTVHPDYALGPHTASLGLAYAGDNALAPLFERGMFVGQHGSWNRKPRSGYKVIFVPFGNGRPSGLPVDVLTGFLTDKGEAMGRPVGVALDSHGALLVADDVGNTIWRVTAASPR